LQLHFDLAMRR